MKNIAFACVLWMTTAGSFAQNKPAAEIPWSAANKLTLNDFQFKKGTDEQGFSNAEFSIMYKASGADLLSKNLNKRVSNLFVRDGSWIDTTQDAQQALRYQQTVFDLCEIYVRQFRKSLYDNKKRIKSLKVVDELNEQYTTAFARRRLEYDRETKAGTDEAAQKAWETTIQNELSALSAHAYEKD